MSITKEQIEMRPLKDIHSNKKRNNLLFSSMEDKPKTVPVEFLDAHSLI